MNPPFEPFGCGFPNRNGFWREGPGNEVVGEAHYFRVQLDFSLRSCFEPTHSQIFCRCQLAGMGANSANKRLMIGLGQSISEREGL